MGLTSDQAVTSSLFPSSTILMLKLVMNYFLQSFPFLLIERRTVVSHWQNPTPCPFVSIRWEQLGVISLPSPPIIQMRTQLSNNIVSSHDHENSREVLVYQCSRSSSRHLPFTFSKKYISGLILVKKTYKASSGMEGERLHVVFGLTGICIDLKWGKLKIFFSETARPTAYICISYGHQHKSCHPCSCCLY